MLPTQKNLKSKLKCKEVIKLSNNFNEMLKISKRYKAGSLSNIYHIICAHRTHIFLRAWGIDDSNHDSIKHNKVFLISDDVDTKYLTSLIMTANYKIRAFTLDENGIDQISSYINCHIALGDELKRDYENYKLKIDSRL